MVIATLINQMKYCDVWNKNDFAKVLCAFNGELGNENFFRILISAAQEAKIFNPISSIKFDDSLMFQNDSFVPFDQYNFTYTPIDLLKWAIKKQFNLPNDFTSILNKRPDQFHESERECVYGMLIGMAMRKYNYDPNAQRNAATGGKNNSIKVDLEHKGIPIDEETVRFHFNAAYEMHKVRIINKKLTE